MSRIKRTLASIAHGTLRVLPRSRLMFKAARFYANYYAGDDNQDPHTNGEYRILREMLPHCRVVFDVGANVGEWSATALAINPNLQLHCFEPGNGALAHLHRRGFGKNVVINPIGLGDEDAQVPLYTFGEAAQTNSLYPREHVDWITPTAPQTIRITTLDAYCGQAGIEQIDYLKLDTEGNEMRIFRGMQRMLSEQRIGVIQFEYGGAYLDAGATLRDILTPFQGGAYRIYKILPKSLLPVERYSEEMETFRLSNWLLMRADDRNNSIHTPKL